MRLVVSIVFISDLILGYVLRFNIKLHIRFRSLKLKRRAGMRIVCCPVEFSNGNSCRDPSLKIRFCIPTSCVLLLCCENVESWHSQKSVSFVKSHMTHCLPHHYLSYCIYILMRGFQEFY